MTATGYRPCMIIHIATNNGHKRSEMQEIMQGHVLRTPADEGIQGFDVDETASTFIGNAMLKAEALFSLIKKPVLADDSGLCVDALGGRPGVLSARYGSINGKPLESEERNALLLREMDGKIDRACRFVCCICLVLSADRFFCVQETCEGILLERPSGKGGFGYDPVMFLPELGKTVAELSMEEKNAVSHRGKALSRILAILDSLPYEN